MPQCPACKRDVVGRAGLCDYCGTVLVPRVTCPGCSRQVAARLSRCQYCGSPLAREPGEPATASHAGPGPSPTLAPSSTRPGPAPDRPPPPSSREAALAIAMASAGFAERATPSRAVTVHFVYVVIGILLAGAMTVAQPEDLVLRLLLFFGGPVAYLFIIALHYKWCQDNERPIYEACEQSATLYRLVLASCFAVGIAALAVVLTHTGIVRPSARRPRILWQSAVTLLCTLAAGGYFTWFALRLFKYKSE